MNQRYTLPFEQIQAADLALVGGKGANLGEMTQAGFPVPPGFCVTTVAFRHFIQASGIADELYASLKQLPSDNIKTVQRVGQQIRARLGQVPIPVDVQASILAAYQSQHSSANTTYAVRSSATAEDLPNASFAGQQDTYLNVRGTDDLLDRIRDCWISLFTDRAILYRMQNDFMHEAVALSVVVQHMILPDISGIMFTADPISGHRQIISIDASYGLGEALVSGLVSADLYKVNKREQSIISIQIADKRLAIRPDPESGTFEEQLSDDLRQRQVLAESQICQLAVVGSRIETHYGAPQDIEWCLADDQLYIVQSRPITSLFPLPAPQPSNELLHIYFSFNHAQVMTDAMPPLAHSIWQILMPFGKTGAATAHNPYLKSAGGRLYMDISPMLRHPLFRRLLPKILTNVDPLIAQAASQITTSDDFRAQGNQAQVSVRNVAHWVLPLMIQAQIWLWWRRPEGAPDALLSRIDAYLKQAATELAAKSPGAARLSYAATLLGTVFVQEAGKIPPVLVAALLGKALIARLTQGHSSPDDLIDLPRGLSGNVTTEMDLAVGDLADIARQSSDLTAHLTTSPTPITLEAIAEVPGSNQFLAAWQQFLTRYGMRGPSEIDISRPRWREAPASLLQVIIGNLQHQAAGAHRVHHQRLVSKGEAAANRLSEAANYGILGPIKAAMVQRLGRVVRHLTAIREHPKFLLMRLFDLVKQTVLEAAEMLKQQGRIEQIDDIWFLELAEIIEALEQPLLELRPRIAQRKVDFAHFQTLTPPRVITSAGEIPTMRHYGQGVPDNALPGNPVSAGVIEGIAHVVQDPQTEVLAPGEILVAPFTDPGWTPLFINAAGLVMEVGGLMTHGSVVAREYGIPAVVGVLDATRLIETGQYIRVHGDGGYVEILKN